ncbi:methyltransferase domain-containing protein [bacterium]|nr:methyltransferase domain-containing protein [bacterium]
MSLYQKLAALKHGTEHLNYGRDIIANWAVESVMGVSNPAILDIGVGKGEDLAQIHKQLGRNAQLYGLEGFEPSRQKALAKGIDARAADIEREVFPFPDTSMDTVIINQVLEHLKEVFFVLSEASRIIKPGGTLIIGVPNLAAWHNRLMLLAGYTPSCIGTVGPHVRGFTRRDLKQTLELGNYFTVQAQAGSGFYPLPETLANFASRIWMGGSVGLFMKATRTDKKGHYREVISAIPMETGYLLPPR